MSKDELWMKYKETDKKEYKQELIEKYVYLAKIVAGRLYNYYGGNIEFDDLLGFGIFGLIDAIQKFDINRDLKFETYAQIRIRGSIIDNLRKIDWIPRTLRKKSKVYEETMRKLENKLGRSASVEELSEELNINKKEVEKTFNEIATFNIASLDDILNNRGEANLRSNLKDDPESIYQEKEIKKILKDSIDLLPNKEKRVISLYYFDELTYKEIGNILKLSESRISQIHSKSLITIKNNLRRLEISDYS